MTSFAYCANCLGLLELRLDGTLRGHWAQGASCPGSGRPPLEDEREAAWEPAPAPTPARRFDRARACWLCDRPASPRESTALGWCTASHRLAGRLELRRRAATRSRSIDAHRQAS